MTKQLLLIGVTAQMLLALPTIDKLKEGESVDGVVKYKEKLYYSVPVSANSALKVKLTNLNADIDLYVAEDRLPSIRDNDCYSANGSTEDEECTITIANNPSIKTKEVKILVYGYRGSDFTLTTVSEEAKYPEKLTLNKGVKKHVNLKQSEDFKFVGKKNVTYQIDLNEMDDDADLRVKVGKKANKHTFDCKSTKGGKDEERCIIKTSNNTTIYINVLGYNETDYKLTIIEHLKNPPISKEELKRMIRNNKDVRNVNTSQITDMSHLCSTSDFNQDISKWDVSNVTNMENMFYYATNFNQDISKWNVSKVTNMNSMFNNAHSFNKPLNDWNVSSVTDMYKMFKAAESFNQPLDKWDVSNVDTMSEMFGQLFGHTVFNQPINNWDVSNVSGMSAMFMNSDFNQPLDKWKISNNTNLDFMFYSSKFQQDIEKWNVNKGINTKFMFTDDEVTPVLPSWYKGGVGLNPEWEGPKRKK